MKIYHLSDLHLGSTLLKFPKSIERNIEIRNTFMKVVEKANQEDVKVILISGDLFDESIIDENLKNDIITLFTKYPSIHFYYLSGNHDGFVKFDVENVFTFDNEYTYYYEENICIAGCNDPTNTSLKLDPNLFNIVMLHGDVYSEINLKELSQYPIDYLALGHFHSFMEGKLNHRGNFVYPGCLEGRGFDECGKKGFIKINIKDHLKYEFIPCAYRTIHEVAIDISDCESNLEAENKILDTLSSYSLKDIIQVNVTGHLKVENMISFKEIEVGVLKRNEFYYLRLKNKMNYRIDASLYVHDHSLKGEFVRMVLNSDEENKEEIIHYGLMAILRGKVEA